MHYQSFLSFHRFFFLLMIAHGVPCIASISNHLRQQNIPPASFPLLYFIFMHALSLPPLPPSLSRSLSNWRSKRLYCRPYAGLTTTVVTEVPSTASETSFADGGWHRVVVERGYPGPAFAGYAYVATATRIVHVLATRNAAHLTHDLLVCITPIG